MLNISPRRALLFLLFAVAMELVAVAVWADASGMGFIERLLG